jgi:hypothetical protein
MSATHVLTIFDWVELPEVSAPTIQSTNDTGTIVIVAKVGFLLATDAVVALAHAGRNQLPAKVEFGRIDGRVYAEFIVAANER